jgi:AAA domain-containing protein
VPARTSKIIPVTKYQESINMLIYGDSGVGKTVFCGTGERSLILGLESGAISAGRQNSSADLWPVKSWQDVEDCYLYLRDNAHPYKWLHIDSLTDMQEKLLRHILGKAVAARPNQDPDIPAIQDHQKWQNMLKRFVNDFNDLPVNVCYTALVMRRENEEAEDLMLPLILGKDYEISAAICGKMHVVGYMSSKVVGDESNEEKRRKVRRILFENVPPYFAKDRFDCLPRYMPSPTIPKIEELIAKSGGLKKSSARPTSARPRAASRTSAARRRRAG